MAKRKQLKYSNMNDLARQGLDRRNSLAYRQEVYREQNRLNELQRAADEEKAAAEAEESSGDVL